MTKRIQDHKEGLKARKSGIVEKLKADIQVIDSEIKRHESALRELRPRMEELSEQLSARTCLDAAIEAAGKLGITLEIKETVAAKKAAKKAPVEVVYKRNAPRYVSSGRGRIAQIVDLIAEGKYTKKQFLNEVERKGLSLSSAKTALSHLKDPSRLGQWKAPDVIKEDKYGRLHF